MTGSEILALAVAITQGAAPAPAIVVETPRAVSHAVLASPDASPPPPSPAELDFGSPPGGYWRPGEVRSPEPPDGHEKILTAAILIPLGAIGTASGAATTWMSAPGHCEQRWGKVGASPDAGQCKGLLVLNAIRTTYGALMLGSGLVLLGIGLHQRKKWQRWKDRGGVAGWMNGTGAGLELTWRF
jgi:hypothetical protein